jgi:hypothetical protein
MNLLMKLLTDDAGQDFAEYGIALAVIGLGAGLVAAVVAGNVADIWDASRDAIEAVVP